MAGYTSIMVQAYSLATGKTIEESLADLGIQHIVESAAIGQPTPTEKSLAEELLQDRIGVKKWSRNV